MSITMMPMDKCLIWPGFEATINLVDGGWASVVESPRAGGKYEITLPAKDLVENFDLGIRARLTTWLVDQRRLGVQCPVVTQDVVKFAEAKRPLRADERAERLLKMIADDTTSVGTPVRFLTSNGEAFAWSESVTRQEVYYLLAYLEKMSWIEDLLTFDVAFSCRVTVEGYTHIADYGTNVDSSQAFVAMWFHDKMNDAFEHGIKPAIEAAGYAPLRIDQKPDVNKIDDEIIAEIRRSRFLVADFTQDKEGARGGVYFEAGFAQGLGIPVIYTCCKNVMDKLHFDTRQYAHIDWETPKELHDGLLNRILARIGEGPGARPAR